MRYSGIYFIQSPSSIYSYDTEFNTSMTTTETVAHSYLYGSGLVGIWSTHFVTFSIVLTTHSHIWNPIENVIVQCDLL